jgi:DNA mismatch repair protein MutS
VDLITNFAFIARANNYSYPIISKDETKMVESRHPVVEKLNTLRTEFIPNTYESRINDNFMLITGPNMSGKSTYIRQIALIQIMFQIGSFVPASEASIKIVDRIFTRIGASDNLARGESTFMVEMNDVANILNNATKNSLIILDEVGRGTSTYDGVAIAWAVAEYIALNLACSTLFATHYHELIRMENLYENITNYKICVEEINSEVYFLYKIEKGPIDKSYGVHVAKLAGVPSAVIEKANEILSDLENKGLFEINSNTNRYRESRKTRQKITSDKQGKLL